MNFFFNVAEGIPEESIEISTIEILRGYLKDTRGGFSGTIIEEFLEIFAIFGKASQEKILKKP